jgi:hypothetical protein
LEAGQIHMLEVIPLKRKNPYLQINVNEVSIEVLSRDRAGQKVFAGVDVGKAGGMMTLMTAVLPKTMVISFHSAMYVQCGGEPMFWPHTARRRHPSLVIK